MVRRLSLAICLCIISASAFAHHGRRFLFVTEFRMPHAGQIFGIADFSIARFKGSDSAVTLEPGLLFAVGDHGRMAAELHGHFAKEGAEKWNYEATGLDFRTRLGGDSRGWNFAAGVEVEAPAHNGPTPVTGELIAGREDSNGVLAVNLFANNEDGLQHKTTWIYRAGYSPNLSGPIGWSLEGQGSLDRDSRHEIALGAAMSLGENKLLKLGVGKEFGPGAADITLHAGLVVRLK